MYILYVDLMLFISCWDQFLCNMSILPNQCILLRWCYHIYLFTHGSAHNVGAALKWRMLWQQQIGKYVVGSHYDLIWSTILEGESDGQKINTQITWNWTAGVPVRIATRHLLYTNHRLQLQPTPMLCFRNNFCRSTKCLFTFNRVAIK
jgi:hypothetical protein